MASAAQASEAGESLALEHGDVELKGRVLPASNLTFFGEVAHDGGSVRCVYKPISGERPLWDFPEGTLAAREVSAYVVSSALGWDIVPLTVLREGPFGPGMVQTWREPDPTQDPVDIVALGEMPEGYLHVLDAVDTDERPVSLVHENSTALRRMAVFDVLINNADRKGGHVLAMETGHRYGVDHGVSFHVDDKLRTVLWGWADQRLDPGDASAVAALAEQVAERGTDIRARLDELLDQDEVLALERRCLGLLTSRKMPLPSAGWPAIPWPAF